MLGKYTIVVIVLLVGLTGSLLAPPRDFPVDSLVQVEPGHNVSLIARGLKSDGAIRSTLVFNLVARLQKADSRIKAGRYTFDKPLTVSQLVKKLGAGEFGTTVSKITIPECSTNKEIGVLLGKELGDSEQGYLFPDTYFFDEFATLDEIRQTMIENFRQKVGTSTLDEVILASIIESEVISEEDMALVSGILKSRLKIGMALQVDSVPSTYEVPGMPSGPVCNPGLKGIKAAQNPTESKYLYYLSGRDGTTHYARTFDEHKLNKSKYLR